MARRRRSNQITIKDPESLAFVGIVCLIFSILLMLSLFVDREKSKVLDIFRDYFGWGVTVMSIVLMLVAIRLLGTKSRYSSTKVVLSLLIFMFCFLGWMHLFTGVDPELSDQLAHEGKYGGIIGNYISQKALSLSPEGAFAFLSILMLTTFLLALDITPKQIGEWIVRIFDFIVSIFVGIRRFFNWIFNLMKRGKSKLDNLELNIRKDNKSSQIEDSKFSPNIRIDNRRKTPENEENISDFNIKMVSDISTKREPAASVTSTSAPNLAPQVSKKSSEINSTGEKLDLSQRLYPDWKLPPLNLLDPLKPKEKDSEEVIKRNARAILETLRSFGIEAKIEKYVQGPAVTQYYIDPAAGVKFSKIANLSKDLALTLAAPAGLRIELVPGTSYIGIDVPNEKRALVQFLESIKPVFEGKDVGNLAMAVGHDVSGKAVIRDLQKMPHILVAGATGMGKSFLINAFILSLLMQKTPDELKFIMIDPKMVEMAPYDGIPHLLTSPITDMSKASTALKWAVNEMEERYKLLKDAKVRNIEDYCSATGELMPYIVIIIDEFADLMMQYRSEVETSIIRLAQKARAVGLHLIIATQRPTADVITGLIRSNIPARVALTVATGIDSRVILDSTGAETLLGRGDMLFKTANDLKPVRIQGLFYTERGADSELSRLLNFIKEQAPDVQYNEDEILSIQAEGGEEEGDFSSDDPLFRQAASIVVGAQKGSASLLQTKMKIGYARAARLIDELETAGVVGPADGPRPREILVTDLEAFFSPKVEDAVD